MIACNLIYLLYRPGQRPLLHTGAQQVDAREEGEEGEEGEEEKEEEEKSEVLAGEPEYWVQCEKCQKWRKLPTPWGPHEDFGCDRILVRCAQPCDVCKTSRCSLSCSPE